MDELERFRQELQDALPHLWDPDFQPSNELYTVLECDPERGPGPVQSRLRHLIEVLKPGPDIPKSNPAWREFGVLHHRFIRRLSQLETALRLQMSVRSVQRVQRQATYVLAQRLWDGHVTQRQSVTGPEAERGQRLPTDALSPSGGTEWTSQLREEMASLRRSAESAQAELHPAVEDALRVVSALPDYAGFEFSAEEAEPGLVVIAHPSVLRELVLSAIKAMLAFTPSAGCLALSARQSGGRVKVVVEAPCWQTEAPPDLTLVQALASETEGLVEWTQGKGRAAITLDLPLAMRPGEQITILVVDDNADLVALFKSYCAGTPYEIIHVREGRHVFEVTEDRPPDVIMLDVLLPDVNGWDLLLDLEADPVTKRIPLIVCSVIGDQRLALSLGARAYLPKPVSRRQLLDALGQVLNRD